LLRIHLVMPEHNKTIADSIKKWAEVSAWDFSLEDMVQWAISGQGEAPDAFFIHGNVLKSTAGTAEERDAILVRALKDIRIARPRSRIILIFHRERQKDRFFLHRIVSLGIYDIHLVTAFGEADIKDWLLVPRTFAHAAEHLRLELPLPAKKREMPGETKPSTRIRGGSLFKVFSGKGKKRAREVGSSKFPAILTDSGLVRLNATSVDELQYQGAEALFIPASWGAQEVKRLRRMVRLQGVPLIVTGQGGPAFLAAGADRCVEKVTETVIGEVRYLRQRLQELWSKANTDALTGCFSRAFWDAWLEEQVQAARRGIGFAIMLIDLDDFKHLNDTEGHQAGDAVLRELGAFLVGSLRLSDIACRYGGEEFVVGCPRTGLLEITALAERLRRTWEAAGKRPTLSIGVAVYDGGDIFRQADLALYQAKQTGKNRVCCSQSDGKTWEQQKTTAWGAGGQTVQEPALLDSLEQTGQIQAVTDLLEPNSQTTACGAAEPVVQETTVLDSLEQTGQIPATGFSAATVHRFPAEQAGNEVCPDTAPEPKVNGLSQKSILEGKPDTTVAPSRLRIASSGRLPDPPNCLNPLFQSSTLAVCTPWVPGTDAISLVLETASQLNKRGLSVVIVDAAFTRPLLAKQIGIPGEVLWQYDWRYVESPLGIKPGLFCYLLDPRSYHPAGGYLEPLNAVLIMAGALADYILIDAGDNPELETPGDRLLVATAVNESILAAWDFYRPFAQGAVVGAEGERFTVFGLPLLSTAGDAAIQAAAVLDHWRPARQLR
jgi:diguanylate cyclase (GGDEF)-like protein